jgi:hypothetical protein
VELCSPKHGWTKLQKKKVTRMQMPIPD